MIILLFFLISSFHIHLAIQTLEILPGTDDLRSGYDGAKMLSGNEQRSRFRIFDLNDQSQTKFIVKTNGKQKDYAVPILVQPTDISVRKEDNCESVAYTYEQFYYSYFQSISFGFGIEIPKFGLGLEYHETLKRVYQAITQKSQAVGTSTVWWGLYSIQLAPSFLLKWDPVFNASVNLLISEASNPTSDSEQQLYNEFIQNYGTHYVSNVIVGGMAHLYCFVSSDYHRVSTYEEITQQISLTARYKALTLNGDIDTGLIYQQIKETFRKNSDTMSVFQPPVDTVKNESLVEAWLRKAGNQPVVINRTLSDIANLIRSNSQVREYLRRTIDFYLENGYLPTFAELNFDFNRARLLSTSSKPVGLIPGLDVVGCGYDSLTLASRSCILDISNTSENEHWTDPYNHSLTYLLPNGFFATNTPESLLINASILITSVEDYYRYTTRIEVENENYFFYQKYKQKITTEFYRRFYQDYYNLAVYLRQIGWYTLSTSVFPYPKLNPTAERAFNRLPTRFNSSDLSIWKDFINSYGTHLVISSQMGGQVWAETWYEQCLTYEHTEIWIDEQVQTTVLFLISWNSDKKEHFRSVDPRFKAYSIFKTQFLGGTESISPEKWDEWASTVKLSPRPISYRLVPLYQLLPEGNHRSALQQAIQYIGREAQLENQMYINKLESLRGPPKTQCSRNRVRRSTLNLIERSTVDVRQALCPYVGYNGSICEGATSRAAFLPVYRRLPVGVGTTIDITTGTILLPAIDFTHKNTTSWIDPYNNQTFWYPEEITVLPVSETENQPQAHVFRTAAELANHWKYAQVRGDWLGGEFGHSQSILNLQSKFFYDDQAIAITQQPHVLYRLKVETLHLNPHVQNAINALPKVYNEAIYADFLRNWGTHIIIKSLIGGMHEQQVLFKDCVFSFNGAITSENLDEYLKQDILAQTLGNSFYAERRKISIDHRLGGNPSLTNVSKWQESLAANPALLKIEELTAWYDVVEDDDIKANLYRIIKDRLDAFEQTRIREETQLVYQNMNARLLTLKGSIGLLNDGVCEITSPVLLDSVANCSNGCLTGLRIKSPAGLSNDRPLWYMRDPATGFVQARVILADQTIVNGPRVSVGCSVISFRMMRTSSAHICVGCTLINSFANSCTCVCPAYPA